ncbi:MAG: sulfite exporter TauE/SafE family protein [Deltaproteobacteria bacterium]|nr:sulfite exporter TauE/SafE family protein [Deltaproteobacteria bacterium]
MDGASLALAGGAAIAGGLVNAIAGGGSLITFPALVALGIPPVAASVTNTVAMCPGYFGATLAQRRQLEGQGARAIRILPIAALGGIGGALLLLGTGERAFTTVVPFLILLAALLLAMQERIKKWLVGRERIARDGWVLVPIALSAVYGGYFGAGLGVMVLAALAICFDENLIKVNALKQSVSLVVNVAAALVFMMSGETVWSVIPVMAGGALLGGALGGLVASRVPPAVLRWMVVTTGIGVSIVYFVKLLR